jgi:hypothetical protein
MPASEIKIHGVTILRDVHVQLHLFIDYFKGFERVPCVQEIYGEKTDEVLHNLKVEFISRWGYMGVNDEDGHLIVSGRYLKQGDETGIYLDVVHELVHVRQFMEGKKLFDEGFEYVDRPTELEAYLHAVKEARRLGMSEEKIFEYLKTEWMSDEEHKRLADAVGIKPEIKHSASSDMGA